MSDHKITKITTSKDEEQPGDLQFDFGIKNGMVIIDFGKLVKWIGLPPDDADEFARLLLRVSQLIKEGHKEAKANLLFLDRPKD